MWYLYLRNLLILWLLSSFLISCGYKFYKKPAYFKSEWKTIYIPPWKNYTSETNLGEILAYELRHKISQGKFLIPVYNKNQADLIFKGEVKRIYLQPVSYQNFIQTKERKINFQGSYQLIERKTGKIILKGAISRYEIYRVPLETANVLDPGREEALKMLAKDVSELILQEIMFKDVEIK